MTFGVTLTIAVRLPEFMSKELLRWRLVEFMKGRSSLDKARITFQVNGKTVESEVDPGMTLLDFLRGELGLTGAKRGCDRGDCGACTVIVDGKAIDSCLTPVMQIDGKDIITVEGLAQDGELHPLQEAFLESGAVQCGFCTPGLMLSSKAFMEEYPECTRQEVREAISGNLCRCTGYKKIVDAIMLASERIASQKRKIVR